MNEQQKQTRYIYIFPEPCKYYFLGQNYHFPRQIIQDLKVINQDMLSDPDLESILFLIEVSYKK